MRGTIAPDGTLTITLKPEECLEAPSEWMLHQDNPRRIIYSGRKWHPCEQCGILLNILRGVKSFTCDDCAKAPMERAK